MDGHIVIKNVVRNVKEDLIGISAYGERKKWINRSNFATIVTGISKLRESCLI